MGRSNMYASKKTVAMAMEVDESGWFELQNANAQLRRVPSTTDVIVLKGSSKKATKVLRSLRVSTPPGVRPAEEREVQLPRLVRLTTDGMQLVTGGGEPLAQVAVWAFSSGNRAGFFSFFNQASGKGYFWFRWGCIWRL